MFRDIHLRKSSQGFTLTELIVAISIFGILASIAIPAYSSWLPDYKLKTAIRDLYSNMQLAKMLSAKRNDTYQIIFDTSDKGSYRIIRPDGTTEKNISFATYDPTGGICYGYGKATRNAGVSATPLSADGVSYDDNKINLYSRGTTGLGYVYLQNKKGTAYAVGTRITGMLVLKKWNESEGKWE